MTTTTTIRGISNYFMNDLQKGILKPILEVVHKDETLSLNIRNGYINIYYRGGSLFKICELTKQVYSISFNVNYLKNSAIKIGLPIPNIHLLPSPVTKQYETAMWIFNLPLLKSAMDIWFGDNHGKYEREFQQLVERTNNNNYATDYFICDVEYTNTRFTGLRADMIAFHWSSTQTARSKSETDLVIIEMKFNDGAINSNTQKAGICDHIKKMQNAINSKSLCLSELAEEMRIIFNQRVKLGLVSCHSVKENKAKEISTVNFNKPEYILLLSDHDPASSALHKELIKVNAMKNLPFEVKISVANFMGYGLFDQFIFPLTDFLEYYKKQIYDNSWLIVPDDEDKSEE